MLRHAKVATASALLLLAALSSAQNGLQARQSLAELYTKYEYMIPMRDGVKLYTAVYVPKNKPGKHPILMERTPYSAGPYGPTSFKNHRGSPALREAGYTFAYQDVRGKYMSEGEFVNVRPQLKKGQTGIDESTDTFDTVEYLVKNVPDNNGAVGLWGISYPGGYAGLGGINSHPALKAISPQAPVSDWFVGDDFHHNGALFLQDGFDFMLGFGQARPKPSPSGGVAPPRVDRGGKTAYDFFLSTGALKNFDALHMKGTVSFWKDMMDHPNYDEFWQDRSLPKNMKGVKCAVLTVGGWFDAEDLWGPLNVYAHTEKQNPATPNTLVMGPWFHGMWAGPTGQTFGDLDFGSKTARYYQDNIEAPFFEKYLRGQNVAAPAEANVFQTGANTWRTFESWPPKGLKKETFFPGPSGTLSQTVPSAEGKDVYDADATAPTPYLADPKVNRRTREYMIDDQRFLSGRKDVVSYVSDAFANDRTFAGPIEADLWVTTTGTDGDFIVKVVDVWPSDSTATSPRGGSMAGYEQLVRWEVLRGKFRNNLSKPQPFKPGEPTRVRFKLNDLLHTVKAGHRLKVIVQSSMFPLIDRNPNKFINIPTADDADFQKAMVEILRTKRHRTKFTFGELLD